MVKEIDWQTKIIKSIVAQGGYARKWATQYTVGVPDIISQLAIVGGMLMEVKLEKDLNKLGFNRKVETTEKQKRELRLWAEAGGFACIGMVSYYGPREVYLTVLPRNKERFGRNNLVYGATVRWENGAFDVVSALKMHLEGAYDDRIAKNFG